MIACVILLDVVSLVEGRLDGPQIILAHPSGKVQAASAGAVRRGVRSDMRLRQARALDPDAEVRPFNETPYLELADSVAEALRVFTIKIEPVTGFWNTRRQKRQDSLHPSAAIHYLDLGKLLRADALALADQISTTLFTQFQACPYIGLAGGKFPAAAAARLARPERPAIIYPGQEADFLSRLPITRLPLDQKISRYLQLLGIRTIGQFAALPAEAVLAQFGQRGRFFHHLANGHDSRPVMVQPPKLVEGIKQVFEEALGDRSSLEMALHTIGCEIGGRLAQRELTTRALELSIHLEDGRKLRANRILREPTRDGKLIGRTLLRLLTPLDIQSGVVAVQVQATELAAVVWQQLDLFASANPLQNRLSDLLDNLVTRFGSEDIYRVSKSERDHWLPEEQFVIEEVSVA